MQSPPLINKLYIAEATLLAVDESIFEFTFCILSLSMTKTVKLAGGEDKPIPQRPTTKTNKQFGITARGLIREQQIPKQMILKNIEKYEPNFFVIWLINCKPIK